MTYPKGYSPPGGPKPYKSVPPGSNRKPKSRRGAVAAVIIVIFLFIIGIAAYSATKPATTSTSTNLAITPEESSSLSSSDASEPVSSPSSGNCDPSYPDACIPSPPPDLDCSDVSQKRFTVAGSDPHGFDRDGDGVGCES